MLNSYATRLLGMSDDDLNNLTENDAFWLRRGLSKKGTTGPKWKQKKWLRDYKYVLENAINELGYTGTGLLPSVSSTVRKEADSLGIKLNPVIKETT